MRGSKEEEEAVCNLCAQWHVYHGPSPQGSPFCLLGGLRTQDEVLKTQNLPNLLGCNFVFLNSVALQSDSDWSASCNLSLEISGKLLAQIGRIWDLIFISYDFITYLSAKRLIDGSSYPT
ncbi:hypothetical protein POTOM_004895 [Populus tomentosa]|uniref:Uncharacterized protein n=1 Tax=Populus tomentosa TaxID=118781 RepID=A0A8X8AL41_POPTO|nr:hypothetical protein POTOM_004893 [Populus tomentosa]KAG6788818.1 hypothetical protein POTOM_004895 [Populus tomentosa]